MKGQTHQHKSVVHLLQQGEHALQGLLALADEPIYKCI